MQVRNIPLAEIVPSELNPRKTFNQEELQELAQSIQENGLIQPITLRKATNKKDAKYEIVCGERRYRACLLIGAENIQAVVKELNDKQAFACMIIENLQRKDIDPMEEAAALNRLYSEGSMTVGEMAKMLGKSNSFVSGRIQLHNTIEPFVQLMRDGILVLTHLLDICKLPAEQQQTLYDACFTEASRARWTYKFPNMPQLHEMIDEHVMNHLSKARFSLTDETLAGACACDKCPLNTANNPENARDVNTPRCMKRECFTAKSRESIFREAKEAVKNGIKAVFAGEYSESESIIQAADAYGIEVSGLGNRQYVLTPVAPDRALYKDEETYATRKANYDKVRAVFDDNIEDGTLTPVFELCYSGLLSGETKYVYCTPDSKDEPFAGNKIADNNRRISELKVKLREANDHRNEDFVEKQRAFMETSQYSTLNIDLSPAENLVFRALILKRLPLAFKESIGCDEATCGQFRTADKAISKNLNAIIREFIRSSLSEKSVNFSPELADMLSLIMEDRFANTKEDIAKALDARYNQSKAGIVAKIDELRAENEKEKSAQDSIKPTAEETSAEDMNDLQEATETPAPDSAPEPDLENPAEATENTEAECEQKESAPGDERETDSDERERSKEEPVPESEQQEADNGENSTSAEEVATTE